MLRLALPLLLLALAACEPTTTTSQRPYDLSGGRGGSR